jgi:hypothetical protein
MLFFLLLCQLFGLPAVLAAAWEFVTGFLMPAAAILSSGLLAIWLQQKEQRRLHEQKLKDDKRSEDARVRAEQARIVERAVGEHKSFITHALVTDEALTVQVLELVQSATADFIMEELPGSTGVGIWLGTKRLRAVMYVQELGHGQSTAFLITNYFANIRTLLGMWRIGAMDTAWFRADERRVGLGAFTLEEEEALFRSTIEDSRGWP